MRRRLACIAACAAGCASGVDVSPAFEVMTYCGAGTPVPGSEIEISRGHARGQLLFIGATTSRGTVFAARLREGTYLVHVVPAPGFALPAGHSGQAPVTLEEGLRGLHRINFRLVPAEGAGQEESGRRCQP